VSAGSFRFITCGRPPRAPPCWRRNWSAAREPIELVQHHILHRIALQLDHHATNLRGQDSSRSRDAVDLPSRGAARRCCSTHRACSPDTGISEMRLLRGPCGWCRSDLCLRITHSIHGRGDRPRRTAGARDDAAGSAPSGPWNDCRSPSILRSGLSISAHQAVGSPLRDCSG